MSPMISYSKSKDEKNKIFQKNFSKEKNDLLKLRKYIENNFEYVGKDFYKKVKEVYYDKKNKKAIYGTTTSEKEKI